MSSHCQFKDHLDEALRDRLVCGLRSEASQKKLVTESELTFQRALEIAQGMEMATAKVQPCLRGQRLSTRSIELITSHMVVEWLF